MANNVTFSVNPTFNMGTFSQRLAADFQAKGYAVNVVDMGGSCSITFDKGTGGINTILGMGEGIKANITQNGNVVTIAFTDEEWTGKIVAIVIGWFLCWIPIVTGIIGVVKQLDLPKSIGATAQTIAASM